MNICIHSIKYSCFSESIFYIWSLLVNNANQVLKKAFFTTKDTQRISQRCTKNLRITRLIPSFT